MTRGSIRCMIALLSTLILSSCDDRGPSDDMARIRNCFEAYFKALRAHQGNAAAALVDSRTVAYYDRMLELALHGDSTAIAELPQLDRIAVLGLRLNDGNGKLTEFDGREVLAMAIDQGFIGNVGMDGFDMGTIEVDGRFAKAPLTMSGFPTPAYFNFRSEDGQWRIDITSLFGFSRIALDHLAISKGMTWEAQAAEILLGPGNDRLPARVWRPFR